MILDLNCIFSGSVASNGSRAGQPISATALATNCIDTRVNGTQPDVGLAGGQTWLIVIVSQAFNNLTSLTVTVESDSVPTINSAPVVHLTATVPLAALSAGAAIIRAQLPSETYKQFLTTRYTVNGTPPTAGAVFAFITPDPQRVINFASSFALDV